MDDTLASILGELWPTWRPQGLVQRFVRRPQHPDAASLGTLRAALNSDDNAPPLGSAP